MAKTPRLSLDLLRGFRAAARHLSSTRAARELFVTQSAISHEVRILEEQIGQPLFLRVNRALKLTQAGEELYRATDEALALIDAAADRLAGSGRTLSVTTTPAFASMWLMPRLRQFTGAHPDIDVRLADTSDLVSLERESVDIAIQYVPPGRDIPGGTRLLDYRFFPSVRPAWRPTVAARCGRLPILRTMCGWVSRSSCMAGHGATGSSGSAR
jgi:LysR family transcriptional regulator, glycine cleavage system transcriptional activator